MKSEAAVCSPHYYTYGNCRVDNYAEDCSIFDAEPFEDCRIEANSQKAGDLRGVMHFGAKARCMMGKISNAEFTTIEKSPYCLKAECKGPKHVVIMVGKEKVDCKVSFKEMPLKK